MLTGDRLQYLADLLPENVSWGDPLNAVMLDQILAAHSAGAEEPEWCERCGYPCKCAQPQPMPQTDAARDAISLLRETLHKAPDYEWGCRRNSLLERIAEIERLERAKGE